MAWSVTISGEQRRVEKVRHHPSGIPGVWLFMGRTEIFRHSLRITLLLAGFLSIGTGVRVASTVYFA